MTLIYGHPSQDFPALPGGLKVVGGQMGGFSPAPVPSTSFNGNVTLFVTGQDSGGTSTPMNLFVGGGNPQAQDTLPLFLFNNRSVGFNQVDLFVKGQGENPGYSPLNEDLNLYIERGPNAGMTLLLCNNYVSNNVPLSITGSGFYQTYVPPQSETAPASTFGSYGYHVFRYDVQEMSDLANSTTPALGLFINGSGGAVNRSTTLFVAGTVASPLSASMTLTIPNSVGNVFDAAPLYVNGFNY
jgi:hypothetical protein